MNLKRIYSSLRFKITLGVLLPSLIVLSLLAYARYTMYQNLLMENLQRSAANAGQIIEGSVEHAVISNDFTTLQQIVDNIDAQPGVQDIFLLNKSGHVLISTEPEMQGQAIDISDATCQACHRYVAASRNENVILTLDNGRKVFRNVNAIDNTSECMQCHDPQTSTLGVLISDFDLAPVEDALRTYRSSTILWSVGSILLILLAVNLLTSKMVIGRLEQFIQAIRRVSQGDLDVRVQSSSADEIGELAQSFNRMADGLKEKARLEESLKEQTQQLQAHAERLSTLNTIAATVSQSLNLKEILNSALDKVLELMRLKAGWIVLHNDETQRLDMAAALGLPEGAALAHDDCAWNRCFCSEVLDRRQSRVFRDLSEEHSCPTAEYFAREGLAFRACVPLTSKDRVLGVMSLIGDTSDGASALTPDTLATLEAIGRQVGIAVENASLYEELREEEMLRRRLLERLITVQEEERKRIALELHDQTGQPLTSLIMTLSVLAEAESPEEVQEHVQELRDTAARILKEVHDLSLELRPSILDDLGLLAALRHLHKEYQDRFHLPVDFQVVGLDSVRLPSEVETALYRIVQEALTNVARHAQARSVSVLLEKRGHSVMLIVEDDGRGFDVTQVMDARLEQRKLGLYGMRERASLLGGTLTIESTPGMGTAVFVEIPLDREKGNHGKDPPPGSG